MVKHASYATTNKPGHSKILPTADRDKRHESQNNEAKKAVDGIYTACSSHAPTLPHPPGTRSTFNTAILFCFSEKNKKGPLWQNQTGV